MGQSLTIKESTGSEVTWKSLDHNGEIWFEGSFDLLGFDPIKFSDEDIALGIKKILKSACRENSDFLSKWKKYRVETKLEFPLEWGLGSSSTLIHCVAQWADVSPFDLFFRVHKGSGYDVACAGASQPISYQLTDESLRFGNVAFDPSFKDKLYFIYSGQKQKSSEGIAHYKSIVKEKEGTISKLNTLTTAITKSKDLKSFEKLMDQHETVISSSLELPKIQDQHFTDYWGKTKSLGAWGGDFILATSNKSQEETRTYFNEKGFNVFIPYNEMVLP